VLGQGRRQLLWFEVTRHPTAAWLARQSPWQNPYVERLIGTVRRECLDRVLVFGEAHLRQILSSYAAYYNEVRTHLALGKDTPLGRAVQRPGTIVAIPILSGLTIMSGYNFRKGQPHSWSHAFPILEGRAPKAALPRRHTGRGLRCLGEIYCSPRQRRPLIGRPMRRSFGPASSRAGGARCAVDGEDVKLPTTLGIPLGFIVNELITNP
jgi:Integrase core domain